MRVFVAGASGAIGRPLVRRLREASHDVTGMTRRPERAEEIRAAGADAVVADALDRDRLVDAVRAARPDVVVHQLTSYTTGPDPRKPATYAATNRLRTQGTHNLVAAAIAAGARRLVAQSVAFLYRPIGGWVKSESDEPWLDAPGHFGGVIDAALELERGVTGADGIEGVVLRFGFFYGPGTGYGADGGYAEEVRRRRLPIVGRGDGTYSFVHLDDAAAATVAACERGAPGIYNIADDEPAPTREWLPVYAAALGAKRPRRVPAAIVRIVAGRAVAAMATGMRGASNEKAARELGWQPSHSSWRTGFASSLS